MEVIKINRIITAVGNPTINNKLKNIKDIEIINKDIQYQDGIIEILEIDKKIDYIILNQFLPGEYKIEGLIECIREINSKIKIIVLLEKFDENLEKILLKKGIYRILKNKEINIDNLINIIKIDEKMEKYNKEIQIEIDKIKNYNNIEKNKCKNKSKNNYLKKIKNNFENIIKKYFENKIEGNNKIINYALKTSNKYKKESNKIKNIKNNRTIKRIKIKIIRIYRKIKNTIINFKIYYFKDEKNKILINSTKNKKNIIAIFGNSGSGKSTMAILFSMVLKNYYKKILILDLDFQNKSIHTILGIKKMLIKNKLKYAQIQEKKIREKSLNSKIIKIDDLIVKFNKKIDVITNIDFFDNEINKFNYEKLNLLLKKLLKKYDLILLDTGNYCNVEKYINLVKISDKSIFLTEGNILNVGKSKIFLDIFNKLNSREKNKIKIIFNKYNKYCIKSYLLKKIYYNFEIIGFINYNALINYYINKNFKSFFINKYFKNRIKKIIIKIFLCNNGYKNIFMKNRKWENGKMEKYKIEK